MTRRKRILVSFAVLLWSVIWTIAAARERQRKRPRETRRSKLLDMINNKITDKNNNTTDTLSDKDSTLLNNTTTASLEENDFLEDVNNNATLRKIFTKNKNKGQKDERIRRPPIDHTNFNKFDNARKQKGGQKSSSSKSGKRKSSAPVVGGIFNRPDSGLKGAHVPKRGKKMQVDLADFSIRISGAHVNYNRLIGTLEDYLLREMGMDFQTLASIELQRLSHFFRGTALVGFVAQEEVISSQIQALSNCRGLQAAVDQTPGIAVGPATVTAIYLDVHPQIPTVFCATAPPPVATPIPPPQPTVRPDPSQPPINIPPIALPTPAPTRMPSPLPTVTPTRPMPTVSPTAAPFTVETDFDRACDEGSSFLYLPSELSEVECTCSRAEQNILCSRPNSRSASCFIPGTDSCSESYERWLFSPTDGTLDAIEVCRDCTGSDCSAQGLARDECLRLYYQGADVTGCAVLRTSQVPPPNLLPECGTCSLCDAAQFADPGIIHTCPDYEGRPDQGFLIDPNMCHSISLDVLFGVGFRFPRTYGELPPVPPPAGTPTVAPGCCSGNVLPCEFFTAESGCISQQGCSFGFGVCFGDALSCASFSSRDDCDDQGGCSWTCTT